MLCWLYCMVPTGSRLTSWVVLESLLIRFLIIVLAHGVKEQTSYCMLLADDMVLCITDKNELEERSRTLKKRSRSGGDSN